MAVVKKYLKLMTGGIQSFIDTKDAIRLENKLKVKNFRSSVTESYRQLLPYYNKYISRLSDKDMPISLELSAFLLAICNILKPGKILDLGSGFSSFVFRFYMANTAPKPTVWSVDDDFGWLNKTKAFLADCGLSTENFIEWDSFIKRENKKFDLILHDLGTMEAREATLGEALNLAAPGGMVILDDMHKPDYAIHVKRFLSNHRLRRYNLRLFTKDAYNRFSYLVIR